MSKAEIIQTIVTSVAALAAIAASIFAILMYIARIKLNQARIEFEKNAKNIQDRQEQMLGEVSDFSKQLMSQTLKVAPQFAFTPYPQLLLDVIPSSGSLFDVRRSHYTPEKEALCESVVKRIHELIDPRVDEENEIRTLILILDAGSTVFPVFQQLCAHPAFKFNISNAKRLRIITNNLPGVSELNRSGRIGDPRQARTLFRCQILSGLAHSQYEASLSDETAPDLKSAVEKARTEQSSGETRVMAITTGNYLSIAEGIMARDLNHVETKSMMLEVADEVYVIAPLGKLLPYSCDEINDVLNFRDKQYCYRTLHNWPQNPATTNLTLIVTARRPEYFSQLAPKVLGMHLSRVQENVRDRYGDCLKQIFFDPLDDTRVRIQCSVIGLERALREYEFPHRNLRESLIRKLESQY